MNAALGGVLAALSWGSADFIARFTGGAVPGHNDGVVRVRPSVKARSKA